MTERGCNAVGIDLGTTYSSMAWMDAQKTARIVQDSSGKAVTPSVVLFDEDEVLVGEFALEQAAVQPERVVQFVKVHMGDAWTIQVDGQTHTPESISAMILAALVREAEPQIGSIDSAVITVPAFFTEKRRRATQQAGEIAGLNVIGTLNEPMSAALAYGLYQSDKEQTAMIYDLGGGTFDITIVRITPNELTELATLGNRQLGGKDWDECLINYAADQFQRKHANDPRESLSAKQDLIISCEEAKRRLTRLKKATIRVNAFGKEHNVEITRDEFEAMTSGLVQTTKLTTEMALEDAGLEWPDISRAVLVGGSTHMPMVRNMLTQVSGKQPDSGVNPVLAVALGAAQYAGLLEAGSAPREIVQKREDDPGVLPPLDQMTLDEPEAQTPAMPKVSFVTAHGVGVKVKRRDRESNTVLIPKNSSVPHSVNRTFPISSNKTGKARSVRIVVTQGDTQNVDLAEVLGTGRISGLPEGAKPGDKVRVTMAFDEQGRLQVDAAHVDSGSQLTLDLQIPGGLREEDVRQYREILETSGLVEQHSQPPDLLAQFIDDDDEDDDDIIDLSPVR